MKINDEQSRMVDLERSESFGYLGFDFRYLSSLRGVMRPYYTPKLFNGYRVQRNGLKAAPA